MTETAAYTPTVTIKRQTDDGALYQHYEGQSSPQRCFVALDIEDGQMWADYSASIGNGTTSRNYHGIERRYTLPGPMRSETVNALMSELAPYAQVVLNHSAIEWDGHNHVAVLGDAAADTEGAIERIIDNYEADYHVWDASDWFAVDDTIREALRAGKTVDELEAEWGDGDGSEGRPYLEGLSSYLEMCAADVAAE
ncbi:MAG TPA: hypothetical protein VNM48_07840 [Chloroflexota bacterium]|nr:hypothetical protein [Chloroflexota bacterium]